MPDNSVSPRIVCMCGKDIGYGIAEFLLDQKAEVRFVVNEYEKSGKWYRTPRELDIIEIPENEIAEYNPDLIIVAFYDRILPEDIYRIPRMGSWNLHLGDAEHYRGAYPNIWALRNGETVYAVTLHRIDAGIDTGEILAKRSFPVSPAITGRELYDMMTDEGMKLFRQYYNCLASGKAPGIARVQDSTEAVTHYRKELSHELYPPEEFINSVRALTFPPFPPPYFMIGKRKFIIVEEQPEDCNE